MTRPISGSDSYSFIDIAVDYYNHPDKLNNLGKFLLMNTIIFGSLSAHTYVLIHFPEITSTIRKVMIFQGTASLFAVAAIQRSMDT